MDKTRHKIHIIIAIGLLAILGPILFNPSMSNKGFLDIPYSFLFLFITWAIFIAVSGYFIEKSRS